MATAVFHELFHIDLLGIKWLNKNKNVQLTPKLIFAGINKELERLVREKNENNLSELQIIDAISNAKASWKEEFNELSKETQK